MLADFILVKPQDQLIHYGKLLNYTPIRMLNYAIIPGSCCEVFPIFIDIFLHHHYLFCLRSAALLSYTLMCSVLFIAVGASSLGLSEQARNLELHPRKTQPAPGVAPRRLQPGWLPGCPGSPAQHKWKVGPLHALLHLHYTLFRFPPG